MARINFREAIHRWEQQSNISPQEATELNLMNYKPRPLTIQGLEDRDEIKKFESCEKLLLS